MSFGDLMITSCSNNVSSDGAGGSKIVADIVTRSNTMDNAGIAHQLPVLSPSIHKSLALSLSLVCSSLRISFFIFSLCT